MIKAGVGMAELEETPASGMKEADTAITSLGRRSTAWASSSRKRRCRPGHAFFHGEKAPPPLAENVVIAVGNCGLYTGPWGVRVEDTNWVKADGHETLTDYRAPADRRLNHPIPFEPEIHRRSASCAVAGGN